MKKSLIHALIIFIIGMFAVIILKPSNFYQNDLTTFKSWKTIDVNKPQTLYNIYIYAALLGLISYYLSQELN